MNPLVSVVLPAYNGERFLAAAIESILDQTYQPLEIIVVDDGSEDRTASIAGRYQLKYIRRVNGGPSAARNTGVAAAHGDFIAFIDQDDLWLPAKVERQVAALSTDTTLGIVTCRMNYLFDGGVAPAWFDPERTPDGAPAYVPSCWLVRQEVMRAVGAFTTEMVYAQDVDWLARAADLGVTSEVVEEVLVIKRVHEDNLSRPSDAASRDLLAAAVRLSLHRKVSTASSS